MKCSVLLLVFVSCGVCLGQKEAFDKVNVQAIMSDSGMDVVKRFAKELMPVAVAVGRPGFVQVVQLANKVGGNAIESGKKLLHQHWKTLVPTVAPYLGSVDDLICAFKDIAKTGGVLPENVDTVLTGVYVVANGLFAKYA